MLDLEISKIKVSVGKTDLAMQLALVMIVEDTKTKLEFGLILSLFKNNSKAFFCTN